MKKKKTTRKRIEMGLELKDGTTIYFHGSLEVLGALADLIAMGLRPHRVEKATR